MSKRKQAENQTSQAATEANASERQPAPNELAKLEKSIDRIWEVAQRSWLGEEPFTGYQTTIVNPVKGIGIIEQSENGMTGVCQLKRSDGFWEVSTYTKPSAERTMRNSRLLKTQTTLQVVSTKPGVPVRTETYNSLSVEGTPVDLTGEESTPALASECLDMTAAFEQLLRTSYSPEEHLGSTALNNPDNS